MASFLAQLQQKKARGRKAIALLIDPDKTGADQLDHTLTLAIANGIDFIFIGGSLLTVDSFEQTVKTAKKQSRIPVVIFPGNNLQISHQADALLMLSLISGRNADLLIGQHIIAAPLLRRSGLEIVSTGYMLIDSGAPTTASYISNTQPIPADKPEIAACTAMAGEMLGLSLIYLDGGSGARNPVSPRMIGAVRRSVSVPLIVGGGINSPERAYDALNAGADLIVIGNAAEKDPMFIERIGGIVQEINIK